MCYEQSYAYGKKLHLDDITLTLDYNIQYSCISKSCCSHGTETAFLEHIKKVLDVYLRGSRESLSGNS